MAFTLLHRRQCIEIFLLESDRRSKTERACDFFFIGFFQMCLLSLRYYYLLISGHERSEWTGDLTKDETEYVIAKILKLKG